MTFNYERLNVLDEFQLDDKMVAIQAAHQNITIDVNANYEFKDIGAYDHKLASHCSLISDLSNAVERGKEILDTIYTYRSISSPISKTGLFNSTNIDMLDKALRVAEVEVQKMIDLVNYYSSTVSIFCKYLSFCSEKFNSASIDDRVIWIMIQCIDTLFLIDILKNVKSSLSNDHSLYKRLLATLNMNSPEYASQLPITSDQTLSFFLAEQNVIMKHLKKQIFSMDPTFSLQEILSCFANKAADWFEEEHYVLPNEKFMLLRSMPCILSLIDNTNPRYSILKLKSIKPEKFSRILKYNPVVLLYADIQINLIDLMKNLPNFSEEIWLPEPVSHAKLATQYQVINHIVDFRRDYLTYCVEFNQLLASISVEQTLSHLGPLDSVNKSLSARIFTTVVRGFKLLGQWTSSILAQAAWKYANPNLDPAYSTILNYERVVRCNYTLDEYHALVELVSTIKKVASMLMKSDARFTPLLRAAIHDHVMEFVDKMQPKRVPADTKAKALDSQFLSLLKILDDTKDLSTETIKPRLDAEGNSSEHKHNQTYRPGTDAYSKPAISANTYFTDPKAAPGHTPRNTDSTSSSIFPRRIVPLSRTQLSILQLTISSNSLSKRKRSFFSSKEFSSFQQKAIQTIYSNLFWHPYLIDYTTTITSLSDLSDLWYRELYLELGHCLQFDIDASLAWNLVNSLFETSLLSDVPFSSESSSDNISSQPSLHSQEHIASKNSPSTFSIRNLDSILYCFDIYNDAAIRALTSFKQQYLYDEIKSEVYLAFDQFVYKLSDQCFTYYKIRASQIMLNKDFQSQLLKSTEIPSLTSEFVSQYRGLFTQCRYQLLCHSINLTSLISERINKLFADNINYAITCFEASPITSIISFQTLLNTIKLTHQIIQEDGLMLQPWDQLLSQVDNSFSLNSFQGRTVLHILYEFVVYLMPNFIYSSTTNQFTLAPPLEKTELPRISMPRANVQFQFGSRNLTSMFDCISESTSNFFGMQHLDNVISLIGKRNIPLVVDELLNNMRLKLCNVIEPYLNQVMSGMPSDKINLPKYHYGLEATYEYFRIKTNDIANYPALYTQVFQHFREWGNSIILSTMIDTAINMSDYIRYIQSAPFIAPSTYAPPLSHSKRVSRNTMKSTITKPNRSMGNSDTLRPSKSTFSQTTNSSSSSPFDPADTGLGKAVLAITQALDHDHEPIPKIVNNDAYATTIEALRLYSPSNKSCFFLRRIFHGIYTMLEPYLDRWGTSAGPVDNDTIPIAQTLEFYRLWSALMFIFLIDTPVNQYYSYQSIEMMGEGFIWAGAVIIYFLGQRHRFEAMDFSYHLERISHLYFFNHNAATTMKGTTTAGYSSVPSGGTNSILNSPYNNSESNITPNSSLGLAFQFLDRLKFIKNINNSIFSILENFSFNLKHQRINYIPPPTTDMELKSEFLPDR